MHAISRTLKTSRKTHRCRLDIMPFDCSIVDVLDYLACGLRGISHTTQWS